MGMRSKGKNSPEKSSLKLHNRDPQLYEKYVENYSYAATEMHSLVIDQQHFFINLFLPPPTSSKE